MLIAIIGILCCFAGTSLVSC